MKKWFIKFIKWLFYTQEKTGVDYSQYHDKSSGKSYIDYVPNDDIWDGLTDEVTNDDIDYLRG